MMSLKGTKLLAGVLVFVFSGFVSAGPQADVSGWTAVDMFVRSQIDLNKARGFTENPYFVDELTHLVLRKFGKELDAEIAPYAENLTPEQREQLKYLLVSDYVSHLHQKSFYPKNAKTLVVKPIKVASVGDKGRVYDYYYAPMSSSIPYPIHWWVQVKVDINGGSGRDCDGNTYDVDGNNNISKIVAKWSGNDVLYEIHFYDEDVPSRSLDKIYDRIRCIRHWGRDRTYGCEDIESIEVTNGYVYFHSDWSHAPHDGHVSDLTYACCSSVRDRPPHVSGKRPYSSHIVIYVSNVWNHLMDTLDTNPCMTKNWGYTAWN
ncbi:hypothetical protein [Thermococcus sp.]|uniref:hypothetical protein n=1 Tax=Thermococcus sp. TaxID=35749 RepID=UPI00262BAC81|nr:hypothetical protein [Thermococcus sp.]